MNMGTAKRALIGVVATCLCIVGSIGECSAADNQQHVKLQAEIMEYAGKHDTNAAIAIDTLGTILEREYKDNNLAYENAKRAESKGNKNEEQIYRGLATGHERIINAVTVLATMEMMRAVVSNPSEQNKISRLLAGYYQKTLDETGVSREFVVKRQEKWGTEDTKATIDARLKNLDDITSSLKHRLDQLQSK
jgi:hypothetical protein